MLAHLFAATVARVPDRTALVYGDSRWSWATLHTRVQHMAHRLAAAGIGRGDHVVLWLANTPTFVISYLAVLDRGAVVVPLNPAMRSGDAPHLPAEIAAVVMASGGEAACEAALQLPGCGPIRLVCSDDGDILADDVAPRAVASTPSPGPDPDAPALLAFSSGATGVPKALYRTHRQCAAEARHFHRTCGTREDDVIFCALPLFHAHGMANAFWASLVSGAALMLMRNPQPFALQAARALDLIVSERVTVLPAVPLMFDALAQVPDDGSKARAAAATSLRLCISAGEPLTSSVADAFLQRFATPIRQLYGCTEAGSVTIDLDAGHCASAGTVGRPMDGVEVELRDGEIAFRSPALTTGYLDTALNTERFDRGWFLTGDEGRFDEAGRLIVAGRKQFMVSIAGQKVSVIEVEDVLRRHPAIADAAVIGVADPRAGQALAAFVVTRANLEVADIVAFCVTHLPNWKRPGRVTIVESLPRTASGKLVRGQLS